MNKKQLIETWESGFLNNNGKDHLIAIFLYGEDTYSQDVFNAIDNDHPQSRKKIHANEVIKMIVRTGEEIATDLKDERHTTKTFNEDCKKKWVAVDDMVKELEIFENDFMFNEEKIKRIGYRKHISIKIRILQNKLTKEVDDDEN